MGFDLTPVYRLHEDVFSAFDRFRITLLAMPWKKYGYPYVYSMDFSRKEIRDMFDKGFRFEEHLEYQYEGEERELKWWLKDVLSSSLWEVRRCEVVEKIQNKV